MLQVRIAKAEVQREAAHGRGAVAVGQGIEKADGVIELPDDAEEKGGVVAGEEEVPDGVEQPGGWGWINDG